MTKNISWQCPYCGRHTTLTEPNMSKGFQKIDLELSDLGENIGIGWFAISCPNSNCRKVELKFDLHTVQSKVDPTKGYYTWRKVEQKGPWTVLPESSAKPQPDYIPQQIRDDYTEACRIKDLSPKASATLSRRCLQGIIRDYWEVDSKPNLKQEINAIEDKVDQSTWKAIDAVRSVGNIGAHMEKDVNLIIDVESDEAELLIELIETLFQEWYVHRHEREESMDSITDLAARKDAERKGLEAGGNLEKFGEC